MPLPVLTVREVMTAEPVVVPADCPIREVMRLMNERRIGAVLVVGPASRLVGIFSERDLLRRIVTAVPGWREDVVRLEDAYGRSGTSAP